MPKTWNHKKECVLSYFLKFPSGTDMFSITAATLVSLLPALINPSPVPAAPSLLACSDRDVLCQCLAETDFGSYTTTGTITSYANAVYEVAGDCKSSLKSSTPLRRAKALMADFLIHI